MIEKILFDCISSMTKSSNYITGHNIQNYKVMEALAIEEVLIDDGMLIVSYNEHKSGTSINYGRLSRQIFWCCSQLIFLLRLFLLTFMDSKYLGNYMHILGKGGVIINLIFLFSLCSFFILRCGLLYSQSKNGHTIFWLFSKFSEDNFNSSNVCGLTSKDFLKLRRMVILSYHLKKILLPLLLLWGLMNSRFCFMAIKSSDDITEILCYIFWFTCFFVNISRHFISTALGLLVSFVYFVYFGYRYEDLNKQLIEGKSKVSRKMLKEVIYEHNKITKFFFHCLLGTFPLGVLYNILIYVAAFTQGFGDPIVHKVTFGGVTLITLILSCLGRVGWIVYTKVRKILTTINIE